MMSIIATSTPTSLARRPRFRRHDPPPFRLTNNDITIIRYVGEHRFLRSTHLVHLLARPADKVLRRLAALYQHGYLDRPRAQLDYLLSAGSAPLIYALGNKGAEVYAESEGVDPPRVDWTDKNRDVHRPYLNHTLMIADFMVALECAVRERSDLKLLSTRDIHAATSRPHGGLRTSWTLAVTLPGADCQLAVAPDKMFGLEFNATGRRNYFMLEADRATMPIYRPSLRQSSFRKKLLTYHHAHRVKAHVDQLGLTGFRVLTITKSEERVASMIDAVMDITSNKGSIAFLFTTAATLAAGDPLSIGWTDGKRQTTTLVPTD